MDIGLRKKNCITSQSSLNVDLELSFLAPVGFLLEGVGRSLGWGWVRGDNPVTNVVATPTSLFLWKQPLF